MTDPNRIVSINQYRLPHHLKQVAIDYVDKLLKAGVIRPSMSVFNSPLMLVKKPNADPRKPLGEQYRLVHNYFFFVVGADMVKLMSNGGPPEFSLSGTTSSTPGLGHHTTV